MSNFLKDVDLLEDLLTRVLVLQLAQFYHLDCNKLSCQLLDCQIDLSKSAFANLFDKLVKVKARGREFLIFTHVLAIVFYNLVSLSHYFIIQLLMLGAI